MFYLRYEQHLLAPAVSMMTQFTHINGIQRNSDNIVCQEPCQEAASAGHTRS